MREINNDHVIVDHCGVCRGTFFDTHEVASSWGKGANPQWWVEQNIADWKGNTGLVCPADGEHMDAYRLSWGKEKRVEVDTCPRCQGLWLDEGEGALMMRVLEAHADEREDADERGWKTYLFQLFTGLPIEVWNPVKRRPLFLYGLMASIVAVFFWQLWVIGSFGDSGVELVRQFSLVPLDVSHGQNLHGIVTHAFLHGGVAHLLGNLYFLWVFGDNIEDRLGWQRFAVIYLLTGLAAAGLQVLTDPTSAIPVVGASGAISGVTGAYLALFPRVRVWVVWFFFRLRIGVYWYFGLWMGVQFLSAWMQLPGVAWYAHIGGFLTGALLGMLFRRPLKRRALA